MTRAQSPIDKTMHEISQTITRINMNIMRLAQLQERLEKQHIARVAAYKAHLTMKKRALRAVKKLKICKVKGI